MNNTIYPCLWFDGEAQQAGAFYQTVFPNVKISEENPIVTMLSMEGQNFMLLNGGPHYTKNPSISFFVICRSEEETEAYWQKLSEGGQALMELGNYPWSEKYGWVQDKFGVSWQLFLGDMGNQKFVPSLLFTQDKAGRAEEAIHFYSNIFPNTETKQISRHTAGYGEVEGSVAHAQFSIDGYELACGDSAASHAFTFNEGISFVKLCKDQQEIDFYWQELQAGGGREQMCGWCKDKFGVSWQIVPENIGEMLKNNPQAMQELMKMKKIEIAKLVS